jgi:hypothetical protein
MMAARVTVAFALGDGAAAEHQEHPGEALDAVRHDVQRRRMTSHVLHEQPAAHGDEQPDQVHDDEDVVGARREEHDRADHRAGDDRDDEHDAGRRRLAARAARRSRGGTARGRLGA